MRRALLLLALLAAGIGDAAAQCTSAAACATTPCIFSAAGSWTAGAGCTAPPNAAGEQWIVQAGHTVNVDAATQTVGTGTVNGTLYWDPGTATRDANGFRNLVVTTTGSFTGVTCSSTGKIVLRNSDRLRFDTTAGAGQLAFSNGCVLDFRGSAFETTVAAVTPSDDDLAVCGNASVVGRKWIITPTAGISTAKVGRRVIFRSGKLAPRHFEIAAVSATQLTLCSSLATGTSLGQKLTPYGTAPGAPIGAGTAAHHSEPEITGGPNSCAGIGNPWTCCTGAGTGCADGPDPAAGDALAIVDDWTIDQSAGTVGWRFNDNGDGTSNCASNPCFGVDPFPFIQYGNLNGIGSGGVSNGVIAGQFVVRGDNEYVPDIIGNNFHGWKSDYGIVWKGIKNTTIGWNAVHDSLQPAGTSDGYCQINVHQNKVSERGLSDTGPANVSIEHNVAWRTKECAFQINDSDNGSETPAVYQASHMVIDANLIYGYCSVAGGNDCTGVQVNSCKGCKVTKNILFDGYNVGVNAGSGIQFGGSAGTDGSYASDNWLVNMAGIGISTSDDQNNYSCVGFGNPNGCCTGLHTGTCGIDNLAAGQKTWMVNNYISHALTGGRGGNWTSFVIKNVGIDNASSFVALRNPIRAWGGFLAEDAAVLALSTCGTGGGANTNKCAGTWVGWGLTEGNRNDTAVSALDLVLGQMSDNPGSPANRYGLDTDQHGAVLNADFDGTVAHITFDNKAADGNGYARMFGFSNIGNPPNPSAWTLTDFLTGYRSNDSLVLCQPGQANLTENAGNSYSLLTDSAVEGGGVYSANCSSTGTVTRVPTISWNNRDGFDYGLRVGSPEYSAGVGGTAMGARAFRFNRDRMQRAWAGILTFDNLFPASFSTGTSNADTDGDGVIDLYDNCDITYNPDQYDGDGDGKGCACDSSGDTCP